MHRTFSWNVRLVDNDSGVDISFFLIQDDLPTEGQIEKVARNYGNYGADNFTVTTIANMQGDNYIL